MLVWNRRRLLDAVGVDEHDPEVAQPPDAGLGADRGHPRLDPRVAEVALLGLAGVPVEVDLLVRAAGHAEAPGAAGLLIDQHDPVLLALVHRAGWTGGHARRVDAVLADARQVHHESVLELEPDLLLQATAVRVARRAGRRRGEVVVPVGPPLEAERLAGHLRDRLRDRLDLGRR